MDTYLKELKSSFVVSRSVRLNENDQSLHDSIIKWMMENPNPNDESVHNFAERLGMEPDRFEEHIYMILSDILNGGKSKNFKGKYDPEQIKMGVEVEVEHTNNKLIAEKIAKDHLAEIPDYYTRLKKMEASAGIED
jgi:Protein of unknown function (DUF5661)